MWGLLQRAIRLKQFNYRGMDGAPSGFLLASVESAARAKGIPWDEGTLAKWTVLADAFQEDFDRRVAKERERAKRKAEEEARRKKR